MVIEQTWNPNPVGIGGQSRAAHPHPLPSIRVGQLQIRAWPADADFVPKVPGATMKFSEPTSFDCVREYGIMKKRNYQESTGRERPTRCAR
jgi:hypothetical protein